VTSPSPSAAYDVRVLVLAPTSRDAALTQSLLSDAGITVETCSSFDLLVAEVAQGAASVLLAEEALTPRNIAAFAECLEGQPNWSDLPVLVLTRPGASSMALTEAVRVLGNVTLLERPVRAGTLVSAIRTAVRARVRQYQIRGHLTDAARASHALRLADQRKHEFLATLGHELRNPLAPLVTGLQLLRASATSDPSTAKVIAVMDRQIAHLTRLVDDLLEVSRITRGLVDVRHEPVDLAVVIKSAIETARPAVESARHELTVDVPAETITISGDLVRLTQVFANILTNAAKYTNPGGHINLTAASDDDQARVVIRDDGIGIPPEHISSIFDMFTQVDRSSRRTQGGLGIGLTLVRSLVTMHGGRVEARSPGPGLGSEFVVELPLSKHVSPAATRSMAGPLPARRILVVDDNRDVADMLGTLLEELGATVRCVHTGADALAALDSFDPEVVLLDIGMPAMDGYEVARRIRSDPGHRDVLIIALSGWGQEQDHERSSAAGCDHHLIKPLNLDKLRQLLQPTHV